MTKVEKQGNLFGQATERDDIGRPTGKEEVFLAFDNRTDAYLGVVVHRSAFGARERAAGLYAVALETVWVRRRT